MNPDTCPTCGYPVRHYCDGNAVHYACMCDYRRRKETKKRVDKKGKGNERND